MKNNFSTRPSLAQWGQNAKEWASNSVNYKDSVLYFGNPYVLYFGDDGFFGETENSGWSLTNLGEEGRERYYMTREGVITKTFHSAVISYFYFGWVEIDATKETKTGYHKPAALELSLFCEIRDRETKEHLCQPFYLPKITLEDTPYDYECQSKAREWEKKGMFNANGVDINPLDLYEMSSTDKEANLYSGPVFTAMF